MSNIMFSATMLIFLCNLLMATPNSLKWTWRLPNYCESFFMNCKKSIETSKITQADCTYFNLHRLEYIAPNAISLRSPLLYRQDYTQSTPFTELAKQNALPTFKCLSPDHLKERLDNHLNYTVGELRAKWIALMPRMALPLKIFNRVKYAEVLNTDLNRLWELEDRSEYSEFIHEVDDVVCGTGEHKIRDLRDGHQEMIRREFGPAAVDRPELKVLTVFLIKDRYEDVLDVDENCYKIDPHHVSNNRVNLNLLTFIAPVETAYPNYWEWIAPRKYSATPFAEDLSGEPSAWCRSHRLVMALSRATLQAGGNVYALTGNQLCSLYVDIKAEERTIRFSFRHADQDFAIKIILWAPPEKNIWAPVTIELNKKVGHLLMGQIVNLTSEFRNWYLPDQTFYSEEPHLSIGDEELTLRFDVLAVQFGDMGLRAERRFSEKFDGSEVATELSYEKRTTFGFGPTRSALTTRTVRPTSGHGSPFRSTLSECDCPSEGDNAEPHCGCSPEPVTPEYKDCECADLHQDNNSSSGKHCNCNP